MNKNYYTKFTYMYTQILKNVENLTENNQMLNVLKITPVETYEYGFKKQVPKIFIFKNMKIY